MDDELLPYLLAELLWCEVLLTVDREDDVDEAQISQTLDNLNTVPFW